MLRVFAAKDPEHVRQVHELLTKNNIRSIVQSDLPLKKLKSFWGELWPAALIENEADAPRAMKIITESAPKIELSHLAWSCKTCGSISPAGATRCLSCRERERERVKATQEARLKSAALLLKVGGAFFVASILAFNVGPYLTGAKNQHGAEVFGMIACISAIVLVVWAALEASREPVDSSVKHE